MASDQNDSLLSLSDTLNHLIQLKFFLLTAPNHLKTSEGIHRHTLPNKEQISCVVWRNVYFITGTDIVRCLSFRFEAFGREITNRKKFEEGIFSDLRNLKCDNDAVLEQPKSEFLDFLYRNNCVRTQKKQKIFYWFSVNHDRLFQDALERDLKKELVNKRASTTALRDPALSFQYDSSRTLHDQLPDIIEKFPRPLADLADASSAMSNITLPSGHIIQIPPQFYPNPMHPGFPGPPEMQVPMLLNQPPVLQSNAINPFAAGQEMGFPPGTDPSVLQQVHHPMIGMPVQAVNPQGIPIQETPGVYPPQFQMPMALPAQGGIPINAVPPQYQPVDMYQQQIQAQVLAQAQAQAAAVAAAQAQIQPQQPRQQQQVLHQPQPVKQELPKSSEADDSVVQQPPQNAESEELESDFPLDYAPHVEDDQLFDPSALGNNVLPDHSLVRNVSSEPFELSQLENDNSIATVSHDHTKLEVMYKQNEDGTFVSVLVPNGTTNSMIDYANAVPVSKPPSSSSPPSETHSTNYSVAENSSSNSKERTTTSGEQIRTKSPFSPENRQEDNVSAQNSHSAFLPKSLKSKISKANIQGATKPYRTNQQQRAISGAIAVQLNSTASKKSSSNISTTTQNTTSQEFNGPTFFIPTPSESGCSDATGYQQELEVSVPEVTSSSPIPFKQMVTADSSKSMQQQFNPRQQPQQVLVNGQGQSIQYFTTSNGVQVPAQVISTAGGSLQFIPTTTAASTLGPNPTMINAMATGNVSTQPPPPSMIQMGSMPGVVMDDFMYLNTELDPTTDFGMGFNWNGGV